MEIERNNKGLYLQNLGGYDGTNLVVRSGNTETLNPDIKSVQQIINEKVDVSAIPTKVSQLTNDSNFITSYTETDPVWTSEKGNYYTKTEIDGKGYLTAHQPLDAYAKKSEIPNVSTKADLVDGKLKSEQLPKLDNIAAATTTEDMITKFNALLTDLKAKGYMTADITA
nr:MAG TPA: Head fiber protein [Bacteriophage sp.]